MHHVTAQGAAGLATINDRTYSHGPTNQRVFGNKNKMPLLETINFNIADVRVSKGESKGKYLLHLDGQDIKATSRFQSSLLGLIGQGSSIFNLFEFDEVVDRFVNKNATRSDVKMTIDRTNNTALGMVNRDKAMVDSGLLLDILHEVQGNDLAFAYEEGKVLSRHAPNSDFERLPQFFGGEEHQMKFFLDCPVDGYGAPSIYLGLIRAICTNGLVAMTAEFRKSLNLPDPKKVSKIGPGGILRRNLENFSIGEHAATGIGGRLEKAIATPVSVREFRNFHRVANQVFAGDSGGTGSRVRLELERMSGHVADSLGITTLSAYDDKPSARVPIDYSVYDVLNMATELATHFPAPEAYSLHGFVGRMLTEQFDIEGLGLKAADPQPFHFLREDEQLALVA